MERNMKTPHYRRNYKAGHKNTSALDLLNTVIIAGLRMVAEREDFQTLGELFHEMDFLMQANGLATRHNDETGEREVYTPNGEE
jgi:hypothetical protein